MPDTETLTLRAECEAAKQELENARAEIARPKGKLQKADLAINELEVLVLKHHPGPFARCPKIICSETRAALAAYREA